VIISKSYIKRTKAFTLNNKAIKAFKKSIYKGRTIKKFELRWYLLRRQIEMCEDS